MSYAISEAAQQVGVTPDTLRYYEKIGLLPPPGRTPGGKRIYQDTDLVRLRFVRRAQAIGFTLDEITSLLRFREDPANSSCAVRELAAHKQKTVREKISLLQEMQAELSLLMRICQGDGDHCPILERLDRDTE